MNSRQPSIFSFRKSTEDILKGSRPLKITTSTPSFRKKVSSLFTVKNKSSEHISVESPLSIENNLLTPPTTPSAPSFNKEENLADQVQKILGSTLDQVDDEIDDDWESHRNALQETLNQTDAWKITL